MSTEKGTARSFPDSLVVIFAFIVVAQLATYLLAPGEFTRESVDGAMRVVAGTYHAVEAAPLPWHTFLTAIPKGLAKAGSIVFFVFIVGGVIGIVRASGALDAIVAAAIRAFGSRPVLLIAGMVTVLAIGASAIGMSEEYLPFVPILVAMCLALKLDAVVAVAIANVAAGVGYGAAALNPFTVIIAQKIAGVPPTSGWLFRCVLFVAFVAVAVHHIASYAARVRSDPSRSLVHDVDYTGITVAHSEHQMTSRRKFVLAAFAASIVLFVVGVARWEWDLPELAAVFLGLGLVSGAIAALSPNQIAKEFTRGAAEMTGTALLIGFARTIQVVLDDAHVIDGIVNGIAAPLDGHGPIASALGMLGVQSSINLLTSSGSGQAYMTMPIMTPLADLTHVTRQTAVLAYQIGDGLLNMAVPTSAVLMGMLALGRVPFTRWMRFVTPLLVKLYVVAVIAVIIAVEIGY
jgi:uncharacterized ion transporter superfamily protein YfcC